MALSLVLGLRLRIGWRGPREILSVKPAEIDRVEHQRGEASVADHIGEHATHEREQDRWAIHKQNGLQQILRNAVQSQ